MPVVSFLNVIGVDWPYVNEDSVLRFASLVRGFGSAVSRTHEDATGAVAGFGQAYQGASTQQMASGWAELSSRHVTEIVHGCAALAAALEAAAGYIVAQKAEAVAELIGMAAAFAADQAAAVATVGLAEAAVPVIIAAGRKLMESLAQDLQQYIVGNLIEAAAKPLMAKIASAAAGLDWSQTTPAHGPSAGFSLDAESARTHTAALREHAGTMRSHAAAFTRGLAELRF